MHEDLNMIAMIGTSDRPCWMAEACKILLLLHAATGIKGKVLNTSCKSECSKVDIISHVDSCVCSSVPGPDTAPIFVLIWLEGD